MFILNPVICKMYVCVIVCELDLGRKLSKIIAIQICIAVFYFLGAFFDVQVLSRYCQQ